MTRKTKTTKTPGRIVQVRVPIATPRRKLYFAYGANTNIAGMAARCPAAEPLYPIKLRGHRLVFRHVADIEPASKAMVWGVVWSITDECERALDRFEGFPRLYIKANASFTDEAGRERDVFFYVMRDRAWEAPPGNSYEDCLREGYAAFKLPAQQLDRALDRALKVRREYRAMAQLDDQRALDLVESLPFNVTTEEDYA